MAPSTLDATQEATQIRMRKSCCNTSPVHTAHAKQHITQQASEWYLAPFICVASCVASSVDVASKTCCCFPPERLLSHNSLQTGHLRPWNSTGGKGVLLRGTLLGYSLGCGYVRSHTHQDRPVKRSRVASVLVIGIAVVFVDEGSHRPPCVLHPGYETEFLFSVSL